MSLFVIFGIGPAHSNASNFGSTYRMKLYYRYYNAGITRRYGIKNKCKIINSFFVLYSVKLSDLRRLPKVPKCLMNIFSLGE